MPAAIGIPNLLSSQTLGNAIRSAREQLDIANKEAVTGLVADKGKALDGDIGKLQRLEQSRDFVEGRENALEFAGRRMTATQTALTTIREDAASLSTDFLIAEDSTSGDVIKIAASQSRFALDSAIARLNTGFGDRPLFGGSQAANVPLADSDTLMNEVRAVVNAAATPADAVTAVEDFFNDPAGGFFTTVYQGGPTDGPGIEIGRGQRVQTDIRADDQAIRDALKAFTMGALSDDPAIGGGARDAFALAAGNELSTSSEGLLNAQSRVGAVEETVERELARFRAEGLTIDQGINSLIGVDQFDAASRVSALSTQLEAAYSITARMSQLNLTNYL